MSLEELLTQVSNEIVANHGPYPSIFTLRCIPAPAGNGADEPKTVVWQAMMQSQMRTVTATESDPREVLETLVSQARSMG
jgi:hypothetical protein